MDTLSIHGDSSPADVSSENLSHSEDVAVVRAPRYARFMILGGLAGATAAFVATIAFPASGGYALPQVFGFLLVGAIPVGLGLGGAAALLVDRRAHRRARWTTAQRVSVSRDDARITQE